MFAAVNSQHVCGDSPHVVRPLLRSGQGSHCKQEHGSQLIVLPQHRYQLLLSSVELATHGGVGIVSLFELLSVDEDTRHKVISIVVKREYLR